MLGAALLLELVQLWVLPNFLQLQLILIITLYVGWYSPPGKAAAWGTVSGLALDYLLGLFLGLNGLSKTLLGFASSYLGRWMPDEARAMRTILLFIASIVDQLMIFAILLLLGEPFPQPSLLIILLRAIGTGIIGTVFFRLYDKIRFPPTDFRRLQEGSRL